MKELLRWIALFISWLFLPPLILLLGYRWKMGNKYSRTAGMLLSPLFLILYLVIYARLFIEDSRKGYFQKTDRIERITGIRLPEFKVLEYHEGERHFTGDFEDYFTFEFEADLPEKIFDKIDEMIINGNQDWRKHGNTYEYSTLWGNGFPAPKGEDDRDDRSFTLTITKGERKGSIRHGMW